MKKALGGAGKWGTRKRLLFRKKWRKIMRILIAEDEVEIARALKVLLEKNKSRRTV